jgi:hypothetical protein
MTDIISRAVGRLRPSRIIRAERMLDLRFFVALALLLAARGLAALVGALGPVALAACGVLVLAAVALWCYRPAVIRAYIPFEHYPWDEQIVMARVAATLTCLCCLRRLDRPGHLEVTRCRCGTVYGTHGAALYVKWAGGREPGQ